MGPQNLTSGGIILGLEENSNIAFAQGLEPTMNWLS